MSKSYSELVKLKTFEERFEYLRTNSSVGADTFGHDRYLNQMLYQISEWKSARNKAIVRDQGCDLGMEGEVIFERLCVHHINPITAEDIVNRNPKLFDLDNLICCSDRTHKAIHYSTYDSLGRDICERKPNDTCPWK